MHITSIAFIGMPGPWELLVIGGIVLLLFGSRLPGAMRNLGRSFVEFKKGVKGIDEEEQSETPAEAQTASGTEAESKEQKDS